MMRSPTRQESVRVSRIVRLSEPQLPFVKHVALNPSKRTVSSIAEEAESGPLVGNPDSHLGRRNVDDAAGNETDPIRDEVGLHAG